MNYIFNDVREAIDGKFLVVKSLNNQAEVGTMVHIMDAQQASDGHISISYRVVETNQDYSAEFKDIKEFCKWSRPDTFIARNYEHFSKEDIQYYIKVSNRSVMSFCVPLIAVSLIIIWAVSLLLLDIPISIIVAACLSVGVAVLIVLFYKKQKDNLKLKLYNKIGSKWGIVFQ